MTSALAICLGSHHEQRPVTPGRRDLTSDFPRYHRRRGLLPFAVHAIDVSLSRSRYRTHLFPEYSIYHTDDAVKMDVSPEPSGEFLVLPKHGRNGPFESSQPALLSSVKEHGIPGSASPVVSNRMWSKAPFRCMSFSIDAMPESLMLQQRHPFASSKISSCVSSGLSGEDTLIVLAGDGEVN